MTNNTTPRIKGYHKYKFPSPGVIPEGAYFSTIVYVRPLNVDTYSSPLEVLHHIRYNEFCWRNANTYQPHRIVVTNYYIKELYSPGSWEYSNFIASMSRAPGIKNTLESAKGVTEYVEICYKKNSDLGGISKRYPVPWHEFLNDVCGACKQITDEEYNYFFNENN